MDINIEKKETAKAILNALSSQVTNVITTLDVLGDNSFVFTLDIVKSRHLQEEQRRDMIKTDVSEPVLFASNRTTTSPVWTFSLKLLKTKRSHKRPLLGQQSTFNLLKIR